MEMIHRHDNIMTLKVDFKTKVRSLENMSSRKLKNRGIIFILASEHLRWVSYIFFIYLYHFAFFSDDPY